MNTITTTTSSTRAATGSRSDARRLRRRGGVAVLTVALLSSTACGSDAKTDAAGIAPGSTTSTSISSTSTTSTTTTTTPTTTTTATTTPTTTEARPTVTFDEMVGGEGERVHVRCTGSGATTVLLTSGFESGAEGWGTIEPTIADRARVCSYDRPGTGTSDPATATATFTTQASNLHELLATINEPGPYVVVGHSFGGAEATTFASQYSDEVTGLVLLDASPVTWPAAVCAVPDDGSETATFFRSLCAMFSDPNANLEHLDVMSAFDEAATITSLGSLPMAVITAADRHITGLPMSEVTRLTDVWTDGQQHWIDLSTAAHLVSVEDTGHYIQLDQPDVVIGEIVRLLP